MDGFGRFMKSILGVVIASLSTSFVFGQGLVSPGNEKPSLSCGSETPLNILVCADRDLIKLDAQHDQILTRVFNAMPQASRVDFGDETRG